MDITCAEGFQARDEAGILDHVRHQLGWIAADAGEFESGFEDKVAEDGVGCEADSVAMFDEFAAEGYEGLDVAAAAYNLYDDVQADRALASLGMG